MPLKWSVIFLRSWTSTGYISNSTGSSVTNCRFSLIIGSRGWKSKHQNDTCLKEIQQILTITLHSTVNTIGWTSASNEEINKQGRSDFHSGFGGSFIHKFASATRVLLCESNWQKLQKMKNEPNNVLTPYTTKWMGVNAIHYIQWGTVSTTKKSILIAVSFGKRWIFPIERDCCCQGAKIGLGVAMG